MVGSASCLKLITCMNGNDDENHDSEAQEVPSKVQENKDSRDRQGWSFRKRSARHRVLNNTVVLESPSYGKKESPECATIETATNSLAQEKASLLHWPFEKPQLLTVDSKEGKVEDETASKSLVSANLEDSLAIAIQTSIRGVLAQTAFLRLKNLVKLQAVVRGHLVRKCAVGTLRCVQAVFKVQALVRSCHLNNGKPRPLGKDNRSLNSVRSTSIENLFGNKFASRLLEYTPKSQAIKIRCDLSNPDNAWKWMERWTFVFSARSSNLEVPEKLEANFIHTKDCNSFDESAVGSSGVEGLFAPENMQSDRGSKTDLISLPAELPHIESEQSEQSTIMSASGHLETEGNNFNLGSKSMISSSIDPTSNGEADISGKRVVENPMLPNLTTEVGGSECGTELSITSTLDSLEISETVAALDHDHGSKSPAQGGCDMSNSDNIGIDETLELKPENDNTNVLPAISEQPIAPSTKSDLFEMGCPSLEASPMLPESEVKNDGMIRKRKKTTKKSPSNTAIDLGKDQKRRCSLDSSSNNGCLPSYMQPTESAKAKAQFTNSPRSSPDVLKDKETVNAKKRHSLPGANGRHGSPRISRSISQAQQMTKGNGSISPHGRKWER